MEIHLARTERAAQPWSCVTCGGEFALAAVNAIVGAVGMSAAERQDQGGYLCPACLAAGPVGLAQRMRAYAEDLRAYAAYLEHRAGEPITLLPCAEPAQRQPGRVPLERGESERSGAA